MDFLRPRLFLPLLLACAALLSAAVADCEFPPNDEGALLTNAARLLRGDVFYRDLDAYPFPAPTYLLAGAMGIFGESVGVARALAAAVYVALVLCLYACALQVGPAARAACAGLLVVGCKGYAWPAYTSYFYSDVSFLGAVAATGAALRFSATGRERWLPAAGLAAALSILSKQSLGLLLLPLLAGSLWFSPATAEAARARRFPRARPLALLSSSALLPCLAALGYFAWHGVAGQMLASGLLRPFTGYLPTSAIPFAPMLAWWEAGSLRGMEAFPYIGAPLWILIAKARFASDALERLCWLFAELSSRAVYTAVPLLLGAAAWRIAAELRRGGGLEADTRRSLPIGALALSATASAFPRSDFFHVMSVYPALLLLGISLRGRRPLGRAEGLAVLAVAAAGVLLLFAYVRNLDRRVELDRARLWVGRDSDWTGRLVEELRREIPPGESFFVYGNEATLYFLADRYFPWPFPQLYPGQEGGDGGRALAAVLRRQRPRLLVRGITSWPGLPPLPEYTPELLAEIRRGWVRDASDHRRGLVPGEPGQAPLLALFRRRDLVPAAEARGPD